MSQTLNALFNQALTAIGHAGNVTDPNADSKQTAVLKLWYPVARRAVLSSFHWASVRRAKRLAIAKSRDLSLDWADTDPLPGYRYAYALPANCLRPQFLGDYSRFALSSLGGEKVLNTNCSRAILYYTEDIDAPSQWEADLYQAIVYALAASINMAHNGKAQLTQKLEQQVHQLTTFAKVADANEDDEYFEAVPGMWAGTGYQAPPAATRSQFIYPTTTFNVSGLMP